MLWQRRCHCNPGHNIFSSFSNQDKTWELGINPEKPHGVTLKGALRKTFRKDAPYDSIFLIYKIFSENDKKTFCFRDFFLLSRYVEGVIFFNVINPKKNYL